MALVKFEGSNALSSRDFGASKTALTKVGLLNRKWPNHGLIAKQRTPTGTNGKKLSLPPSNLLPKLI